LLKTFPCLSKILTKTRLTEDIKMDIGAVSGSTDFTSTLSSLSDFFTTTNILMILILTLLILILYSYVFFMSSRWILKWYGAKKIPREEKSLLYSIIEELSKKAGVRSPEILSFDSVVPAMFTVGSGSKSFIVVSTSMLEIFNELEIEALIAHEIGHIKNNDVSLNTITAYLASLIMSFPYLIMWGSLLIGFGQPEDPAPRFFRFMATAFAAPPAAILVHLTNPAKRELKADEIGVKLTGNPIILAKTLEYLENYIPLQPVSNKFTPGYFHLFSTHTQQIRGYLSIFTSLFDTHPGIEERIVHILKYSNNPEINTSISKYARVPGFFDLKSWRFALATSLLSYISFLFVFIIVITFALKDFNFFVTAIIAGIYIGAMILLIGVTASLSRRLHHTK
jgi:heat shock protein HtpX